jgi:NitT/TauT family transport system permease protein
MLKNMDMLISYSGITLGEAFLGFICANILSFIIAVIFIFSKTIKLGVYPILISLQVVPIIALSPLIILWFGTGLLSKVVVVTLLCFFPILINTLKGFQNINTEYLDLFKVYSASKWTIFTMLRLPFSWPYIFSALKISSTLAVVGAIIGEFVGSDKGLGFLVLTSSYRLRTDIMFSAIIFSSVVSLMFFYLIVFLEKLFVKKGHYYDVH